MVGVIAHVIWFSYMLVMEVALRAVAAFLAESSPPRWPQGSP
jgi:hypothetical protein